MPAGPVTLSGCTRLIDQLRSLDVSGVTIPISDAPVNCDPPLFVETQAVVNRLKWGKAPEICGIHTATISKLVKMLHL